MTSARFHVRLVVSIVGAFAGLLLPLVALADLPLPVICTGLAGCGQGPENTLLVNILPAVVAFTIKLAAGGTVVFVVISGVRFLLSNGDEGAVAKAKKNIYTSLGGLALALTAATIVGFVVTENYGQNDPVNFVFGDGGLMASTIRLILILFNVGFVLIVTIAGLRMVLAQGESGEFKKCGEAIKWAIVGAIVVNLARILVGVFLNLNL